MPLMACGVLDIAFKQSFDQRSDHKSGEASAVSTTSSILARALSLRGLAGFSCPISRRMRALMAVEDWLEPSVPASWLEKK